VAVGTRDAVDATRRGQDVGVRYICCCGAM